MTIIEASTFFNGTTGSLTGKEVVKSARTLRDITGIFEDQKALEEVDLDQIAYEVEIHEPVKGAEGGLLFGTSYIHSGKVGNEYFMTKGHFHEIRNRAEYYWGIKGEGLLLLMDEDRKCWAEKVSEGSLHYIPRNVAHRLINTGEEILTVGACWPSDAGHDYGTIQKEGFSVRVKEIDGRPVLQEN